MDKLRVMHAFSTGRLDFMDNQHIMMGMSTGRTDLMEKHRGEEEKNHTRRKERRRNILEI